jgi:hypothetical protein
MRDELTRWVADQPDDDVLDVAAAATRGHRAFVRWLLVRCTMALVVAVALVVGAFSSRPANLTGHPMHIAVSPAPRLLVSPPQGAAPLSMQADASGSTPAAGAQISNYTFDFGDGSTVGPQPGPSAGHTYNTAGTYTVTVVVTDSDGGTGKYSRTVTVS